jgi:hypothetical protein
VSTMWRTVGQNPWLWEQCTLRITKKNICHFLSLMNLPIFSRLRAISICPDVLASTGNKETPSQVLKAIQSRRSIRRLYIGGNDLSMVEPGILAEALSSLEVVHTHCTKLTKIQIEFLLNSCQQEGRLRELNISGNDLTNIDQNLK